MSRKLRGNGLWESSRMMLPEHKEAFLQHRSRPLHRPPQLDEQQRERIGTVLTWSFRQKGTVTVTYRNGGKTQEITGIITQIETDRRKLHIQGDSQNKWLDLDAILDVDGFY